MRLTLHIRLAIAIALPAAVLASAAHAATATAIDTDTLEERDRPNNHFLYMLTQLPTMWSDMVPMANSNASLLNANGNGSLQVCPERGLGSSLGYSGALGPTGCNFNQSFSLNNSGNSIGGDGFAASTARMTGYKDGRLEIIGRNGISIEGPTTFNSNVGMSNKQINRLAAATADTDAVNLQQLKSLASYLGGGAQFNADGSFKGPTHNLRNGGPQTTVGGALSALDDAIMQNTDDISGLNTRASNHEADIMDMNARLNGIDQGAGIARQDNGTSVITVGSHLGGSVVDVSGTGGPRVLSGVGNGTRDTDAATLAQLKAMGLYDPVNDRILGALLYDGNSLDRSTLGGSNGTVIANLAGGLIAKNSLEAINGGQLYDMRNLLQDQLDDLDGRVGRIEDDIADGGNGARRGGDGDGDIDVEGKPIKNLGDGVDVTDAASVGQVNEALKTANTYTDAKFNELNSTDAASVAQVNEALETANTYTDTKFNELNGALDAFKSDVNRRFQQMGNRIDRMGAISAAQTQMAINASGATTTRGRLAAGLGLQNGRSALSVGYASRVTSRVSLSVGAAFSGSENNVGAGVGVDF